MFCSAANFLWLLFKRTVNQDADENSKSEYGEADAKPNGHQGSRADLRCFDIRPCHMSSIKFAFVS